MRVASERPSRACSVTCATAYLWKYSITGPDDPAGVHHTGMHRRVFDSGLGGRDTVVPSFTQSSGV